MKTTHYHGGPFAGYETNGWRDKARTTQIATMSAEVSRTDNLPANLRRGAYVWDRDEGEVRHFRWI